jgi:hypothetical protein
MNHPIAIFTLRQQAIYGKLARDLEVRPALGPSDPDHVCDAEQLHEQ